MTSDDLELLQMQIDTEFGNLVQIRILGGNNG